MRNALLVVDVQADFVEGGSLGVKGGLTVAAMIARHVRHFRNEYQFVVASRDYHENAPDHISDQPDFQNTWPPHCMAGTPGAAFVPTIQNLVREKFIQEVVTKGRNAAAYSAFDGYDKRGHLLLDVLRVRNRHRLLRACQRARRAEEPVSGARPGQPVRSGRRGHRPAGAGGDEGGRLPAAGSHGPLNDYFSGRYLNDTFSFTR